MLMSLNKKFLVIFLIFVFAVTVRIWGLNQMGRVWDEPAQFQDGHNFIKLLAKGDFSNPYFYDHPYHPPLSKYLYGLTSYLDIESSKPGQNPFLEGEPTFKYDITYSRLVSVIFSSFTVIFIILIGWQILPVVGIISGLIFSTLPFLLGLSQVASIESILIFFFTASIFSFFKFLEKRSWSWTIITGVLLGLSLETKFTNVMLYPLLLVCFVLYWYFEGKKKKNLLDLKIIYIFLISFFVFFILWPMPWFHLSYVLDLNNKLRFVESKYSVPEVFYGKLLLVPKIYYFVMFLITTPLLTILSFFLGSKIISDLTMRNSKLNFLKRFDFKLPRTDIFHYRRPWFLLSILIWFLFPFLQSFYNFRQHGIRYIIQIYSPFSIIAAFGFVYILSLLKNKLQKSLLICFFCIYLFFPLASISPYYLDYFNSLVGGPENVYKKRMFQLGWWGQGIKEASEYLKNNAKAGSTVGLAVVPLEAVSNMPLLNTEKYTPNRNYDYVMVSYFNVVREGFDDSKIREKCRMIYSVMANGARLVNNYKCK